MLQQVQHDKNSLCTQQKPLWDKNQKKINQSNNHTNKPVLQNALAILDGFLTIKVLTVADILSTYDRTDSKSNGLLTTISPRDVIGSSNLVAPSF